MKKPLIFALIVSGLFCLEATMELNAQSQTGIQKILVAYFSWGGNTRGIAQQIHQRAGRDRSSIELFEIQCVTPYSRNYNTCLDEALRDQRANARPALRTHVGNIAQYDVIMLGYPNWWASIPAPIASFLDEYDLAGKTIIPFCSHGGGRFGQSLTAIAKLEPGAKIGDALSVHYSGGSTLANDITAWLRKNGITAR
ncbi:MAG: NAD(P)H-dependent oxidoreductase [Spirochaetaceae bacterium]|jgi:flavodoxin|nr:NAD(P)H-dependent oxidoreductase [Spirochaetaceae bacterium]